MTTFFVYGENEVREAGPSRVPYERWNADKHWARHTYNMVVLCHIQRETRDAREKLQAGREIEIAERKRAFWVRHPNFSAASAAALFRKEYRMNVPA